MFTKDNDNEMEKERKFVFTGNEESWPAFKRGTIYKGGYSPSGTKVSRYAELAPTYWQEVFETEPSKPLLKDTDLGHFAGIAMQAYLSNPNPDVVRMDQDEISEYAVRHAKSLIEELRKEIPQ